MPENEPIRRFVPLPTQFLQEEEPSDIDDDDERNADYDQPLAHFQHASAHSALTSAQDRHVQPFSSGRGISSSSFYGISQRNLNYGQNHSVVDDMPSGQTLRNFMSRSIPNNDDCSQNSYDYQEVFDDPHQLIPSYHEYSITNSPPHSYSPTSGDSAGMPEYFISRMAPTTVRSGGLGYGSHAAEQGDTIYCESQQRLQEPKVISNESNRYTVVGHTVEGQPIYALQSVRTQERPRLHQGSLYRVMESNAQPRYVFLRQQVGPVCRTQRDSTDINSSNENYRAVAREIVAKALEDKRQKQQFSQESQPSSSGISSIAGKTKKKIVTSDNGETEKISGSTVAAQVAAIQRFSTPLGWKQMGSWLKTAEMNEDWSRLKLLLSQCAQANLTLELLQSNDTPKFVRKLSKTCPDQDVRKISNDLVICWKRLVSTPPHQVPEELKKVGSAKRKTPHLASGGASKAKIKKDNLDSAKIIEKEAELDGNKQKDLSGNKVECSKKFSSAESSEKSDAGSVKAEKPVKASSSKSNKIEKTEKSSESNKTASSKLNEFNMFEKLGEERKEKKRRPKTAKTYTSKFRSTGLEGDDELAMGKVGASTVAASKKKSSLPSKALLDAKKRTGVPASVPKVLPVNTSPPLSSIPFSDKKPTSNTPARVMMSNTFMDALMDPVHKKAPIKQTKKRSTNLKPSTSVIPSVMEGLYSDTSRSLNKEKQDEGLTDEKKEVMVEEPDITPIGNRKIRFADEHGQELVEVRYFEIEEGERLNVSKLSSEDMKHLEMQRERTFMKEQRNLHITEFGFSSGRSEGITHIPWKLIPLTDAIFFERRGSQSEAKKIEEERQKTIMMPFYDPSLPAELADAEPELLASAILPPTEIPLESEADDEDHNQDVSQTFASATTATGNLAGQNQSEGKEIDVQKLMTELKKKGLVGSSSDLASILNKVSSTATIAGTTTVSTPSAPQITVAATPTYAQLTAHSGIPNIPNMSLPPPRFAHGLPMPSVLSAGQYILPIQQQQPLLNGPVPAGVTPTVGVDLTTQSGPSTSEALSYNTYGRPAVKQCTFYQSGTCSYGARCRFAHGDEPTVGAQGYGYSDERGRSFRRGGQSLRGGPRRGGADGGYRRGRGGLSFSRRGFYDRERDRDREREYDYERRIYDRYGRRRKRSSSRSRSRSRSRSKSVSPFERRAYSPDRRRRGSPRITHECDEEDHFEKRSRSDDRERNDQHAVDVENRLSDAKPLLQEHRGTEENDCKSMESVVNSDQRKSPPEDPIPSTKSTESVRATATDSPASPV